MAFKAALKQGKFDGAANFIFSRSASRCILNNGGKVDLNIRLTA